MTKKRVWFICEDADKETKPQPPVKAIGQVILHLASFAIHELIEDYERRNTGAKELVLGLESKGIRVYELANTIDRLCSMGDHDDNYTADETVGLGPKMP